MSQKLSQRKINQIKHVERLLQFKVQDYFNKCYNLAIFYNAREEYALNIALTNVASATREVYDN